MKPFTITATPLQALALQVALERLNAAPSIKAGERLPLSQGGYVQTHGGWWFDNLVGNEKPAVLAAIAARLAAAPDELRAKLPGADKLLPLPAHELDDLVAQLFPELA